MKETKPLGYCSAVDILHPHPSFTRMLSDLHPWALLLDEETGRENSCDLFKPHAWKVLRWGRDSIWPELSLNLLSSQE